MEIVIALVALLVGAVIGFFIGRSMKSGVEAKATMLEQQIAQTKDDYENRLAQLANQNDKQLVQVKTDYKEQLATIQAQQKEQIAELEKKQKEQLEASMNLIREQLQNSAEKVLKERSEELSANNKEQLSQILNPLQTNLQQMKEEVEKNRTERAETMTDLKAVINTTMAQTREIGERADNLANALTRDNKYQGNFGELRLSKMLEDMGFERGKQFEEQVTLRDDDGKTMYGEDSDKRMQPDVILHFPDNRDIIIDSKVSMTAFERYANAKTDEEKKAAMHEHVASVRNQVRLLTQKTYWKQYNQKGVKLDFVVMFMFSESALQLALSEDTNLWHEAYNQGVLITGGQNLYALLRILEISWKQMAQVENQENIMQCANDIVSRVQLFYERVQNLENQFQSVDKCFRELKSVTSDRGKSIIVSANKLISYGAKEDPKRKKSLPKEGEIEA